MPFHRASGLVQLDLGLTREARLLIAYSWVHLVGGKLGLQVVPGCLAADEYISTGLQQRIFIQCAESDYGSLRCVEALDEELGTAL